MESQPQNPEFRNNPENFHPCVLVSQSTLLGHEKEYHFIDVLFISLLCATFCNHC